MRLAVLSDLHANWEALRAVADDLLAADQIVCLGDLVGYYCQVNEVVAWVREHVSICVRGNHDDYLLRGCPPDANESVRFGIDFAAQVIDPEHLGWLEALPLSWAGFFGGASVLLVHGSPWRPLSDYLYRDSPLLPGLDAFDYDVVAFGQTHRHLCRSEAKPLLLNPGSVGQSRDRPGLARACFVDTATLAVEVVERTYDAARVVNLAKHHGAGEWVRKFLA